MISRSSTCDIFFYNNGFSGRLCGLRVADESCKPVGNNSSNLEETNPISGKLIDNAKDKFYFQIIKRFEDQSEINKKTLPSDIKNTINEAIRESKGLLEYGLKRRYSSDQT